MMLKLTLAGGSTLWVSPGAIATMSNSEKGAKVETFSGDIYSFTESAEEIIALLAQMEMLDYRMLAAPITGGYSEEDIIRASSKLKDPKATTRKVPLKLSEPVGD